ncbi:MAG: orotidine-5'-phosphate decarboxylase [Opitutae bacterium]|nr:orotidine-5'-phosphate decarboxylase [Opitutae bacterium]|tara:strand:+ start:13877 stop:14602 length:726 start_codon:yes stop_codon:yes gene_type:complete
MQTQKSTEVILALDVESRTQAEKIVQAAGENLKWIKIGLQTYLRDGPAFVSDLASEGKKIFLDLKLHDIPNTMAKAIESLAHLPVSMLTIHASAGTEALARCSETIIEALPEATLLAVTVLTSMDAENLNRMGVMNTPEDQVTKLAKLATEAGVGGIVCSPKELSSLYDALPSGVSFVTPGIRPAGTDLGDQKRVMTPAEAAQAGANYLVIGRPILGAENPDKVIAQIQEEVSSSQPSFLS